MRNPNTIQEYSCALCTKRESTPLEGVIMNGYVDKPEESIS